MKKKKPTPPYVKRAMETYRERLRSAGYVYYRKMVRESWKPKIDALIEYLKREEEKTLDKPPTDTKN